MKYIFHINVHDFSDSPPDDPAPKPGKVILEFDAFLYADGNAKKGKWIVPREFLEAERGEWAHFEPHPPPGYLGYYEISDIDRGFIDLLDTETRLKTYMRFEVPKFRPSIGETGSGRIFRGKLATHPEISWRIRAIDPIR